MENGRVRGALEITVPAQAASLARVRRLLSAFLAEHDVREDRAHNVVMVAHELAANAIVHGGGGRDEVVAITITLETQSLAIRVLGPAGTGATPASLEPSDSRESGRGMLIVERLATWTEELSDGRRAVTANVPLGP
jgi:anti-sigma regulatory factor (Ser/Thr protein kinase)